MSAPPPRTADRRLVVALALTVVGLLLWIGSQLVATGGEHSWDRDATAPSTYEFVAGETYGISIHGGVDALQRRGVVLSTLSCTFTPVGGGARQLALTLESDGTRALNQLASFIAPAGGRAAVQCVGAGAVFVDDAADAGFDYPGLMLLLGIGLLVVGVPLLLSAVRLRRLSPPVPVA